jgi:regulator of protease activity HflC (stomatin/prohibitin superfamily)
MDISIDDANSAPDREGQKVYASIQINFRTNGENVQNAYGKVGLDKEMPQILNINGIIVEAFKTVTAQYDSKNLFEKREEIKQKAIEQIRSNFPNDYLILENVVISNIGYSKEFQDALESKKVFEQKSLAKTQEAEYQKQEALRQIESAKGEAESNKVRQIATYEADAKKIELEARATATSILIKGEAEAQALALKKNELTPLMVTNNWIDTFGNTWDGKFPVMVTGDSMATFMQMAMPFGAGNFSTVSSG